MAAISNDWLPVLKPEFGKEYYRELYRFVNDEYRNGVVYPPADRIFEALHLTPLHSVKVVILGQDPYHNDGQAHGLCFSVKKGVPLPPSLVNIYKEITDDLGVRMPEHGELTGWARQGVLLLNTVLTVREGQPNSHKDKGWEIFTDRIISELNKKEQPIVFLLWGANAVKKASVITNPKHYKLTAPHPSPLSAYRGFFGCRHFSKANTLLEQNGIKKIDWEKL